VVRDRDGRQAAPAGEVHHLGRRVVAVAVRRVYVQIGPTRRRGPDPAADALWDSVEVVATLEGTEHKAPKTDDDWKVLRQHAIALVEASNLLLIPGRHVAKPGEKADDARVDLHPEEIEKLLAGDPAAWALRAHTLQDAATESLKAIDARDVTGLMNSGETLDSACESCHRNYWYRTPPPDAASGSVRQ